MIGNQNSDIVYSRDKLQFESHSQSFVVIFPQILWQNRRISSISWLNLLIISIGKNTEMNLTTDQ